jgi:hypothetical protein
MHWEDVQQNRKRAVERLREQSQRDDSVQVVSVLDEGLTLLRDLFMDRLNESLEKAVSRDSMLVPVSVVKARVLTTSAIEIYMAAESAAVVREHAYVQNVDQWYGQWLLQLRLGESGTGPKDLDQVKHYLSQSEDARRLEFTNVLARVFPESRKTPLVLFRLFPLAAQVVACASFGDRNCAAKIRNHQVSLLSAIADCSQCHGAVLANGEQCPRCGNPVWNLRWLTATE